ncbi:MAG: lipid-A-disaccharide synthase-related protein [Pseudanabaenaceae cyanobacterium bins.68]|nr:lipid-A-disaccharide synthase-related protein [Pseudanabaenaceae cyanobacterium bins.68]
MMEVLCVSNGHGEDQVAVRIALELLDLGVQVTALPMVGLGAAYLKAEIPILSGGVKAMPSGGFVRMDATQLARDLKGGLLKLTWRQLQLVSFWSKQKSKSQRLILAVGDLVPLLLAWLPTWTGGCDFCFVATAKTEYYWRDRQGRLPGVKAPWGGSMFFPWERWLVTQPKCRETFVRDRLTADWLNQKFRLGVKYFGNPMMDGLEPAALNLNISDQDWIISLIPGSRPPEAYHNLDLLLQAADILARHLPQSVHFLAAIAPELELEQITPLLQQKGWTSQAEQTFRHGNARLYLSSEFGTCLHLCHLGVAMAGTATEQLVGLGKPAIAIAGSGPQFTKQFALDQARLLGISIKLIDKPSQIGQVIDQILQDPDYFQIVLENGRERMGQPGASRSIAKSIVQLGASF